MSESEGECKESGQITDCKIALKDQELKVVYIFQYLRSMTEKDWGMAE